MERVNSSFGNIKDKWSAISRPMKIGIISGLLSLIAIGVISFTLLTRVQYGVLFANVNQGDAGNITATLKSQNVPYKLEDGGTTIMIPADKVDQTRIDLAMANKLPNSTSGFELFDKTNMMTTDQDRKIMYQRALTGELERSISSLNAVQSARVILVTPSQSVFDDSTDKKASASVILTLKGNTISNSAVQGIVALTSASVENLNPDNVKVVDSNGRILADGDSGNDNPLTGGNSKFLQMKQQYENQLTQKLSTLLTPIYGAGKFQVAINVDLDFNSVERNTVKYSNPNIRSENLQIAGNNANNQQTSGQPDNAANVAGAKNDQNGTFNRTINNELDTDTTKIINAPGSVQRITASVVLNGDANNAASANQVQTMVANAIGLDSKRGDAVNIQDVSFAKTKMNTTSSPKEAKKANDLWIYLAVEAGILTLGLATFFIIRSRRRNEEEDEYEYDDYEDEAKEVPEAPKSAPVELDENAESVVESKTNQAKDFAMKNPDIVADLVKTWVREDK
ncbi:flagellar M-ring protein FliF [Periweissella fabaria]|uniref:Flagellar M-ring protein n=1 Tax=Periweissella fabaria TaxID=546157 RepID=A0ABM8Z6M0_9LACO|nr:flagellar basal-body MS-ring/collar protein FliF [Periweissella fabaria]MCM0597010.1 flagellar M-ring protein FliF [Periweissella fabaria]CAH0416965.1 Flagellar M-ring protein [Periweissella fabaria]